MIDIDKIFQLCTDVDALLVISEKNRRYFTGFASTAGYLLIMAEKCYFFTDSRYLEMAESLNSDTLSVVAIGEKTAMQLLKEIFAENNVKRVGYEDTELTVKQFQMLTTQLPDVTFSPVGDNINTLRITKTEGEIELIRTAQSFTDKAFKEILKFIKVGVTEQDIAVELEYQLKRAGGDGLAFDTIIASGVNSSKPHAHPTDKKIEAGDPVTMDFGASYRGYCSDMTRTIFVGEPSAEIANIYNVVLMAQKNAINNVACGMTGHEIDSLAREIIVANGFGEYFTHSTGHSLGLDIHEEPRAAKNNQSVFTNNTFVTIEPGIYIPKVGGVRIEDLLLIKEDEVIDLTTSEKNVIII
jgi:Xaa-Pro aminopeptidase